MRFWITKNSEVPIREQVVRQVILGILSEDLPAGHRLPSIRAIARRYHVHSNTVSSAYHDLLNQGWLELRRGSGVYVRIPPTAAEGNDFDELLKSLLRATDIMGHKQEAVLERLGQMVSPRDYTRAVIVEPDAGMREILRTELAAHLTVPVDAVEPPAVASIADLASCVLIVLPTRAAMVRELLPAGTPHVILRLRSVRGSLETETRPSPNATIAIASKSVEFRQWARAVLISVGLDPQSLCEVDTAMDAWQERASASEVLIADVVAAAALPEGQAAKVFRVVADSCIAEIRQMFNK